MHCFDPIAATRDGHRRMIASGVHLFSPRLICVMGPI
jgi:hypothetical protein